MRTGLICGWMIVCGVGCTDVEESKPAPTFTWHSDVKPLVEGYCTRCHMEGGIGIGDFRDQDVVYALADIMVARIEDGTMPPPVSDPDCADYMASEHMSVSAEHREVFRTWLAEGKPEGDPEQSVAGPSVQVPELPDANLEVRIASGYTPTFSDPNKLGNEYRCFVLDPEHTEDLYITAMHPIIDNVSISHHAVLAKLPRSILPAVIRGPSGFDCFDQNINDRLMAAWAPGNMPLRFEEGMGMRLKRNEVFVLQMHYFMSGPDSLTVSDRPGYRFKTQDSVDQVVEMLTIGDYNFTIPAGAKDYTYTTEKTARQDYQIVGALPHMHVLGASYDFRIKDSDTCVTQANRYDFDNQLMYQFKEPIAVKEGETLSMTCTWDNSDSNPDQLNDPIQDVPAGEFTNEEMCFAFTLVVAD